MSGCCGWLKAKEAWEKAGSLLKVLVTNLHYDINGMFFCEIFNVCPPLIKNEFEDSDFGCDCFFFNLLTIPRSWHTLDS